MSTTIDYDQLLKYYTYTDACPNCGPAHFVITLDNWRQCLKCKCVFIELSFWNNPAMIEELFYPEDFDIEETSQLGAEE